MFFVILLLVSTGTACELSGYTSGVCVKLEKVIDKMPFCGPWVGEQICVPKSQVRILSKA